MTVHRARPIWWVMSIGSPGGGAGVSAGMNGVQFEGCTKNEPMAMKAMTTVSFMATTMLLTVADSETPSTSRPVTATIAQIAGRFTTPMAVMAPLAAMTGTPGAAVN